MLTLENYEIAHKRLIHFRGERIRILEMCWITISSSTSLIDRFWRESCRQSEKYEIVTVSFMRYESYNEHLAAITEYCICNLLFARKFAVHNIIYYRLNVCLATLDLKFWKILKMKCFQSFVIFELWLGFLRLENINNRSARNKWPVAQQREWDDRKERFKFFEWHRWRLVPLIAHWYLTLVQKWKTP